MGRVDDGQEREDSNDRYTGPELRLDKDPHGNDKTPLQSVWLNLIPT